MKNIISLIYFVANLYVILNIFFIRIIKILCTIWRTCFSWCWTCFSLCDTSTTTYTRNICCFWNRNIICDCILWACCSYWRCRSCNWTRCLWGSCRFCSWYICWTWNFWSNYWTCWGCCRWSRCWTCSTCWSWCFWTYCYTWCNWCCRCNRHRCNCFSSCWCYRSSCCTFWCCDWRSCGWGSVTLTCTDSCGCNCCSIRCRFIRLSCVTNHDQSTKQDRADSDIQFTNRETTLLTKDIFTHISS